MPFQTGDITLNTILRNYELKKGICSCCLEGATEKAIDNSFSDQFGQVASWDVGSDCCKADVFEGAITFEKISIHTAKKDHSDKRGTVLVKQGQRYRCRYARGYYIDTDGNHKGIVHINKTPLEDDLTPDKVREVVVHMRERSAKGHEDGTRIHLRYQRMQGIERTAQDRMDAQRAVQLGLPLNTYTGRVSRIFYNQKNELCLMLYVELERDHKYRHFNLDKGTVKKLVVLGD